MFGEHINNNPILEQHVLETINKGECPKCGGSTIGPLSLNTLFPIPFYEVECLCGFHYFPGSSQFKEGNYNILCKPDIFEEDLLDGLEPKLDDL